MSRVLLAREVVTQETVDLERRYVITKETVDQGKSLVCCYGYRAEMFR